jgi:hypothetical protein
MLRFLRNLWYAPRRLAVLDARTFVMQREVEWIVRKLSRVEDVSRLRPAVERLTRKTQALADAMHAPGLSSRIAVGGIMPNPLLSELEAQITAATTVVQSATTLILGIPGLIQSAVDAAIANGATAEQLAPFDALGDELQAKAAALAAAVSANTPTP